MPVVARQDQCSGEETRVGAALGAISGPVRIRSGVQTPSLLKGSGQRKVVAGEWQGGARAILVPALFWCQSLCHGRDYSTSSYAFKLLWKRL
jgi:hypothetical protein